MSFAIYRKSAAAACRLERFHEVLRAANQTDYYRPLLAQASLDRPDRIAALESIAEGLRRLPPLPLSRFLAERPRFHNPAAAKLDPPGLFYPHDRTPRTAILASGFSERDPGVRLFPGGLSPDLARFCPEALAGPVPVLRRLTSDVRSGRIPLRPLTHAVIAFTLPGEPRLSEEDRELFWRVYRVPSFEQMLGFGSELLAWECEGHEDLHVNTERAVFETADGGSLPQLLVSSLDNLSEPLLRLSIDGAVNTGLTPCACGQVVERLLAARGAAPLSSCPSCRPAPRLRTP